MCTLCLVAKLYLPYIPAILLITFYYVWSKITLQGLHYIAILYNAYTLFIHINTKLFPLLWYLGYCILVHVFTLQYNTVAAYLIHSNYIFIDVHVQSAANYLRGKYNKSRFHYAPNDWPPYHPKHYTTLALVHHKGKCINTEIISIAEGLVTKGNLSKSQPSSSNIGYHSKDISELFPSNFVSSYFLLIEGAPGIGKTVLSKRNCLPMG